MKKLLGILALMSFATGALAMDSGCAAQAAEKKLAGAAKTSFIKKCEANLVTTCDAMAKEKKLAGAARNSFTKKCMADQKG